MNYKVPFRHCYAETLTDWVKYTAWCHLVMRVFPAASDAGVTS